MPLEIEIKLKVETHEGVRRRLVAVNAERVGTVRETNIFFDRPDGSLRHSDSGLRVRFTTSENEPEPKALITFKGPAAKVGLNSREAFDLHVMPPEQVVPMLLAMGFVQLFLFEKERESWLTGEPGEGECLVELDTLPHFGRFVEIEGPSEEAVKAVQRDLGLEGMPAHGESYAKMVHEYLKERGGRELRF